MCADFVNPTPGFAPPPDMLAAYIRGQMAPMQVANAQQQLQMGQAQLAMVPGQLQSQQLNLDQLRLALQRQQILTNAAGQLAGQPEAGTSGAGAQNGAGASGGIQNGPQGSVSATDSSMPQSSQQAPSSYGGSASSPNFPLSTGSMMAVGMLAPEAIKGMQEGRDAALKQAQLQAEGPLNLFDAVANSPSPARMAMNNPSIISRWPQVAQQMGLDPVKDFNDQNVARAAIFGGNQIRAQVGLSLRDMPLQQKIIYGPNGQILSQNTQTNEIKQDVAPQDLKEVIGPDGQPVYRPAGQAAGMRPFNAQLYASDAVTDPAKELAYQRFIATGEMPSGGSRGSAIQQATLANYIAQRAQSEGNSGAAIAARAQAYKAQQGVLEAFTSGGAGSPAQALNSINTAVTHMAALDPLIDQLNNVGNRAWNTAANAWEKSTGSPAPTNFAAIKEFVGGEVAKAVLPGGGGEAERQALLDPLNAANSSDQLKQAVGQIKTALAGKTEALRTQWDIGTNGTQGAFDKFLMPATKDALGMVGGGGAPSAGTPSAGTPGQFQSANDVKAAFQAGTISREQAKQLLTSQFGMQ